MFFFQTNIIIMREGHTENASKNKYKRKKENLKTKTYFLFLQLCSSVLFVAHFAIVLILLFWSIRPTRNLGR